MRRQAPASAFTGALARGLLRLALRAGAVAAIVGAVCFALVRALPGDAAYRIAAGRYGYEGKGGRPAPHDQTKVAVVALVERKGRAVAFTTPNVTGKTLQEAIRSRVHLNSHMMTDELHAYQGLVNGYAQHDTIKHSDGVYAKATSTRTPWKASTACSSAA